MNNIKKEFSIRDLENLSGIKAHTIRIWEKRYKLLAPERTTTNIRTYSLSSLQKLLNITTLYNAGHKISKIAKLSNEEVPQLVIELAASKNKNNHAIASLKLAMINFDQQEFFKTIDRISEEMSFKEVWQKVFLPLLDEIGLLWQTDTICPSHEHFISHLIKHLIFVNTEPLKNQGKLNDKRTFVLFLPENEIHELGLLYLNYELLLMGHKTIYLGQATPLEALEDITQYFDNLVFVSYFTVAPSPDKINKYIDDFQQIVNSKNMFQLWILGQQIDKLENLILPENIKTFATLSATINFLSTI